MKHALKQVYFKFAAAYPREGRSPARQVEPVLGLSRNEQPISFSRTIVIKMTISRIRGIEISEIDE